MSALSSRLVGRILERTLRRGIEIVVLDRIDLMLVHRAEIHLQGHHQDHHRDGEQCVEVIRDGLQEEAHAVLSLDEAGHGRRPGGNRGDDADRCRGGVDEVRQLRTADLMLIGHRTHDGADRQTVEVVVDEDEAAKGDRGELCAGPRPDVLRCPVTERGRATTAVHELYHRTEDDEEAEDADIIAVGQNRDDTIDEDVVDGALEVITGKQERTGQDTEEKGAVYLLRDERECDGDDRRHERPGGLLHRVSGGDEAGDHDKHEDDSDGGQRCEAVASMLSVFKLHKISLPGRVPLCSLPGESWVDNSRFAEQFRPSGLWS